MRVKLVLATSNKHKLKEIGRILKTKVTAVPFSGREDGKTFEENAVKKARFASNRTGKISIADDSGLEVECLNGKPGVRSARFAGPNAIKEGGNIYSRLLCEKLLKAMRNCKDRKAQFVCVIAIAYPDGKIKTVKGICKGKIIHEMRGKQGFGYDPVFVPNGYKKTFAEMKPEMKNKLSHRGKALRKLKRA